MEENTNSETFEAVWNTCTANNRLCPKYEIWQTVFKMLKETDKLGGHGGDREPADPYILYHNWDSIIPIELQFQFQRYIEWAEDNDQLAEVGQYLSSLSEDSWIHFGEK